MQRAEVVAHRHEDALARHGRVRDQLRLQPTQDAVVAIEEAVHDVLAQPGKVRSLRLEHRSGHLFAIDQVQEVQAALLVGFVEHGVLSCGVALDLDFSSLSLFFFFLGEGERGEDRKGR